MVNNYNCLAIAGREAWAMFLEEGWFLGTKLIWVGVGVSRNQGLVDMGFGWVEYGWRVGEGWVKGGYWLVNR